MFHVDTIIIFITQEDILELLQELGSVGEAPEQRIRGKTDMDALKKLIKLAGGIDEFEAQLGSKILHFLLSFITF